MKYLFTFILSILILPVNADWNIPEKIPQGSTLEINISDNTISEISGKLENQKLIFEKTEKKPKISEFITRGEFMELIIQNNPTAHNIHTEVVQDFPDVPNTDPFYKSIMQAAQLNIIHGYDNGQFGPKDNLTRAQASKIITQAFPESPKNKLPFYFADVPKTHSLKKYMKQAFERNIFQGYPDGNFRPNKYLSINEAFIITQRAIKNEISKPSFSRTHFQALVGISRLKPARKTEIILNIKDRNNSEFSKTFNLEILKRNFETRSFDLPTPKEKLLKGEKKDNSWDMIFGSQKNSIQKKLWTGKFIKPTEGEKTLGYGNILFINGKPSGSHFGHDYANIEGTPIYAANNGKIVLADWTPSYGNTIMIDHGRNVFTMYLHNSKLKVKKGDWVKKGDLIALMGKTGIATGSHLHYSHWVGDVIVDGEEWFKKEY